MGMDAACRQVAQHVGSLNVSDGKCYKRCCFFKGGNLLINLFPIEVMQESPLPHPPQSWALSPAVKMCKMPPALNLIFRIHTTLNYFLGSLQPPFMSFQCGYLSDKIKN